MNLARWAAVALLAATASAHALDIEPYSAAALKQAQTNNQAVALHFHADWCPTCRAQTKAMDELKSDPQLAKVTVLVANYDKEKELKSALGVRQQSTFIVYHGSKETGRMAGQTKPEAIKAVLASALQ